MVIFLEGCDKTGKSTLASKLLKSGLGKKIIHFEKPKGNWYEEYVSFLSNVEDGTICDRGPLGQFVYGPIMRGEAIDYEKFYNILILMRARNSIVFHLSGSRDKIRELFVRDKEGYVNTTQIDAICDEYKKLFNEREFPLPVFDVNAWRPYDREFFRKSTSGFCMYNTTVREYGLNYVGLKYPRALLIGEKFNERNSKKRYAFPFDFGRSSVLLKSCIPLNADVGYTNAFDGMDLRKKVDAIRPEKVIAFGDVASEECNFNDIPHIKLPHPAYISRFPDSKKTISTSDWVNKLLNLIQ